MTLGDRIAVMKGGEVQQCAPPLEVYAKPVNRFVASFVGMPPMNFFEGKIAQEGGKIVFDTSHGFLAVPDKDGKSSSRSNRRFGRLWRPVLRCFRSDQQPIRPQRMLILCR